jgi:hypothetical protein
VFITRETRLEISVTTFISVLTAIQFFPSYGAHLLNEFLFFVFINVLDSINLLPAEGSLASRVCNKTPLKIK